MVSHNLIVYFLGSLFLAVSSVVYAFWEHSYFYPSLVYLSQSTISILSLSNFAALATIASGRLIQTVFLGKLSSHEVEAVKDQARYALMESMLALTMFRGDLGAAAFVQFLVLFFFKIFHWILVPRIESMAYAQNISVLEHVRIIIFQLWLMIVDISAFSILVSLMAVDNAPSYYLLFAFEYAILGLEAITVSCKYSLMVYERYYTVNWEEKPFYVFYVELSSDLSRFALFGLFFGIVTSKYGIPIHLIRGLYVSYLTLKSRFKQYMLYRNLVNLLRDRFPNATQEELDAVDNTCIICREEMISAKKLPCGHLFHEACLRTWVQRSSTCPTCRAVIPAANAAAEQPVEEPVPERVPDQQNPVPQDAEGEDEFHERLDRYDRQIREQRRREARNRVPEAKESVDSPNVDARLPIRAVLEAQTELVQQQIEHHNDTLVMLNAQFAHLIALQESLEEQ